MKKKIILHCGAALSAVAIGLTSVSIFADESPTTPTDPNNPVPSTIVSSSADASSTDISSSSSAIGGDSSVPYVSTSTTPSSTVPSSSNTTPESSSSVNDGTVPVDPGNGNNNSSSSSSSSNSNASSSPSSSSNSNSGSGSSKSSSGADAEATNTSSNTVSLSNPIPIAGNQSIIATQSGGQVVVQKADGSTQTVSAESVGFSVNKDGSMTGTDASGQSVTLPSTGEKSAVSAYATLAGTFAIAAAAFFGFKKKTN